MTSQYCGGCDREGRNCYFLVYFITVDMQTMKDFTDAPIILGKPFLGTVKAIMDWGK